MTQTAETIQNKERPASYRWYALGVLVLVYVSNNVDRQIVAILLEPIKNDLGASDTQMGFLIGITFALFYATLGLPIAMWADRGNRRNIITIAISIWSGMTVLCGYAQSFVQLALARIGVGVGEAGSSPPSHSMISDLFSPTERGTAMGIFALSANIAMLISFLGGGWMSEHWGWRTTFIVVGVPGLIVALLVRFTLDEPVRGASDEAHSLKDAPPLMEVARHLWRTQSARHVIAGCSLAGFVGYGIILWLPAYFVRSHGLSQTEVGLSLALLTGVVGGAGTFAAGRLADLMSKRDLRWFALVAAIGKGGLVPFLIWFFWIQDFKWAVVAYLIPAFFSGFYLAPTFALIQSLVRPEMRAVAAAITLFMMSMIGMGLGPQGVGIMSDLLSEQYGRESLRYTLMVFGTVNLWCAFHYFLAARTLNEDIARVRAFQ